MAEEAVTSDSRVSHRQLLPTTDELGRGILSPARVAALLMMGGAGAILIAAHLLLPDPTGYGTHELARGEWAAAFGIHVLGPAAYLVTWGVLLSGVVGLVRNRRALPQWLSGQRAGRVILLIILLGWVANLARVLLRT